MVYRLLYILILLLNAAWASADSVDEDTLYSRLDAAINSSPEYVAAHNRGINSLRKSYFEAENGEERYNLAMNLYDEYKSFMNDSAFVYLERCIEISRAIGRKDLENNGIVLMALQYSTSGMYAEALNMLKMVSKNDFDRAGLANYYKVYNHVFYELSINTILPKMRNEYVRLADVYRDSLYKTSNESAEDVLLRKELEAVDSRNYSGALKINDERMKQTPRYSRNYAIVAYYRSQIYMAMGDMHKMKYWLVESTITDIKHAVMDQGALSNLARMLNEEGDMERSYRYIKFTSDCGNHFNTRMRNWQITPVLSLIDYNYQRQLSATNAQLRAYIVMISLLGALFLCLLVYAYLQNKRLALARRMHREANVELKLLNERLETYNSKLSSTNNKLNETNMIKEKYIGLFLSICSKYIDKLDDYRRMVNRKLKNKEIDELYKISKSSELKDNELEELYNSFDTTFLNLFPNFVNDFNAMLKPQEHVIPKKENRLTTEIRIFALIRLGIEDSSKIAEFLHYSVNTIYNYRAKVKNGAISDRENFEKKIKKIGMNS